MRARRGLAGVIGLVLVAGVAGAAARDGGDSTPARAVGGRLEARSELAPDRPGPGPGPSVAGPAPATVAAAASAPLAALHTFDGCTDTLDHLKREGLARVTAWGLPSPTVAVADAVAAPAAGSAPGGGGESAPVASPSADGYSGTNVQEDGVDEPDVVKNDGERILTLFDGRLRLLVLDDGTPSVAATLALGTEHDAEMLVVDDMAVVLARRWDEQGSPSTRMLFVDVATPADVHVVADLAVEGHYVSARSANGAVRVVVTQPGPTLPFTYPQRDDEAAVAEALDHNRRVVAASSLEDWLPTAPPSPTGCDGVYAPTAFAGFGTTAVFTIDPRSAEVVDAASVVASASEVYASIDHLYVAATVWPTDGEYRPDRELTHLHQFDISNPRDAEYEASGAVAGHLLRPFMGGSQGQWAMSGYDGDLRVATTVDAVDSGASVSTVTVLRRDGATLVPIGAVSGLGPTEQIYAVRFMDARGYVVTYRRVDPLYVLDLADPSAPRVLGELKVPGYSAYLHPIGDGLLLGVGQDDPNEDGAVDGTQVSVFDVSDPEHPRQTANLSLGERGTWSAVEGDHRAFTWWADPGRAVLPLSTWDGTPFSGAAALAVSRDSIVEMGRVEHRTGTSDQCIVPIVRSRVIGGVIYTFSSAGVRANDVEDFDARGSLRYDDTPPCPEDSPPSTTTSTTPPLVPTAPSDR